MSIPASNPLLVADGQRRWWLPSLSQFIWVVFFLGLILTQWRLVLISADGDACLHWRIGNWMIQHHAIIRSDVFSHTRAGAPLISKEWLSEVLFAALGNTFGWNGIVLLAAALIATTLWLLHRQLLAEGNELLSSTAFILIAALACSVHWLARPHLFTHFLAVVFAWQLRWFDCGRLRTRQLFLRLVPLMLLWVNLHGAFFTGFVIIGTYLLGSIVTVLASDPAQRTVARRRLVALVILAGACGLTTLLNPNGWKLPVHVLEFFRDPTLAHYTNEFRSPSFHSPGARGLLLELALVAGTFLIVRPKLCATDIVVLATWALLALFAARNIPIFALTATPILAACWQPILKDESRGLLAGYRRVSTSLAQFNQTAGRWAIMFLALIAMLVVVGKPHIVGGDPLLPSEVLPDRFPVAATSFINSYPQAIHDEMFNDYGWGGYLMFAMPKHPVFIDGRNDFYGIDFVRQFDRVSQIHPGWSEVLKRYNVGWTILPRIHALNQILALSNDWRLVYTDEVTTIYGRLDGP